MKSGLLAGFVALVFVGGIAVGVGLADKPAAAPVAQSPGEAAPAPAGAPRVGLAPGAPGAPAAGPAAPGAPGPTATPAAPAPRPAGGGAIVESEPPPPAPPPPAPEALAESERLRATPRREDGRGGGQVVDLNTTDSPEERAQWEQERRASWKARLDREREIKVRALDEKCHLSPAQRTQLDLILEAETRERMRLVDALSAGTISNPGFDEGVKRNVEQARTELRQLLTAEQLAIYDALAPREQVLREETH